MVVITWKIRDSHAFLVSKVKARPQRRPQTHWRSPGKSPIGRARPISAIFDYQMTTFCIGDDPTAFSPHPQFTPRGESHKVWRQEKEDQQAKPAQHRSRCVQVIFSLNLFLIQRIIPLSAQISGSKFQNLSQLPLKNCGVWKIVVFDSNTTIFLRGVWLKHH